MTFDLPLFQARIPALSARDPDPSPLFPPAFLDLYEVHSYRNAARILATACPDEFGELVDALMGFRIATADIVRPGGSKSDIAKSMEALLVPRGWHETRIQGDLLVTRTVTVPRPDAPLDGREKRTTTASELYRIDGFVDGHKIDFVKSRVAFDMEWNSKDQTFDRDLYAARAFYDCGLVSASVLLTRSADLAPLFAEIGARVTVKDLKNKYGASTTWMGKLLYRLDAGRGGGCPVLALGIKPAVVADFPDWKASHPPVRRVPEPDEFAGVLGGAADPED